MNSVLEYGSLRLSNGSEGYLEIYLGYDWGFVCEDSFFTYYYYYYYSVDEDSIADIACQQIGYPSALSNQRTYYNPYYTNTPNLVIYDCDADTPRLDNCSGTYESVLCDYRWSLVCQTGKYKFLFTNIYNNGPYSCNIYFEL